RQDRTAEQVAPVAKSRQPREGEVARAENLRCQVDPHALHERDGEQKQHHRSVHGEDLIVGLRRHEVRRGSRELDTGQHAEHATNREEYERRGHEAQADDGVVDRGEALQPWPSRPDRGELSMQPQRRASLWRSIDGRAHSFTLEDAAAWASAAEKSFAGWTMTANRIRG